MPSDPLGPHYSIVATSLLEGRVVPLLGAGANLCDRKEGQAFTEGECLPSGAELADYLKEKYKYPYDDRDLVRISQYIAVEAGQGHLYRELRELLAHDYEPSCLHRFLARLPGVMRAQGRPVRYQLIVTTNYDDMLEKALRDEGEEFDVVTYSEPEGVFVHIPHEGTATIVEQGRANEYMVAQNEDLELVRTVVMKIHGALDRASADGDSFVITEDDYIEYLTRSDIQQLVPANLVKTFTNSHILFLGYSLRDWNLRVILHRIWGDRKLSERWMPWAVQWQPDPLETEFWNMRGVRIVEARLADYVCALDDSMRGAPATSAPA